MASRTEYFVLSLTLLLHLIASICGDCVWYGICHSESTGDSKTYQNCAYNGPPKMLTDNKTLSVLQSLCPEMVEEAKEGGLCCDKQQIQVFYKNMDAPRSMFSRCPSCYKNFAQLWCQSTCSPRQAEFVTVTGTSALNSTKNGTNYITSITYYMTPQFADKLHDSCKKVQFPATGEPAINVMCGSAKVCTLKAWFHFLGNTVVNYLAPFNIDMDYSHNTTFKLGNQSVTPTNAKMYSCAVAPNEQTSPCSCQDCQAQCKKVLPYPALVKDNCYIGLVSCYTFIAILMFCGGLMAILIIAAMHIFLMGRNIPRGFDKPLRNNSSGNISGTSYTYKSTPQDTLMLQDISCCDKFGYKWDKLMEKACTRWGILCTRYPVFVLLFGVGVSIVCSCGLIYVNFTTDPVKLWSSPTSIARVDKDYFDQQFGPFYRTEQLIITPRNMSAFTHNNVVTYEDEMWGPVFTNEMLHEVFALQKTIANLRVSLNGKEVGLDDICYKPTDTGCTIMSIANYFQNNVTILDYQHTEMGFVDSDYFTHLTSCFGQPTALQDTTPARLSCMGTFGGPIYPYIALGGFTYGQANASGYGEPAQANYASATALVITFVVNNHNEPSKNVKAKAWEKELIEYLKNYESELFTVEFMAERSIQDEITRESKSDVFTILISYVFMFAYIAFALGQYQVHGNNLCYLLVQSKVMLGLAGVLIVGLSVTSSIGIYALFGVPATMIILEVQPFLVLAVGVDNIFIFVQAYQRDRQPKSESVERRIGRISGEVIPSMLLSSVSEAFCFLLGALSSMPAVKIFSLYAGLAILFDFFLQITCFLALFTLDIRRQESGRVEVCCCIQLPADNTESSGVLHSLFKKYYTPFLLSKPVRFIVTILFFGWFCSSVAVINKIELGLDQKLSMPEDSYVLRYFEAMQEYLSVGPPVYFVVKGEFNYSNPELQNRVCGGAGCMQNSLNGIIERAAGSPNNSLIAHPASNWLDDYISWSNPSATCCYLNKTTHEYCPSSSNHSLCDACNITINKGRPQQQQFYKYLDNFLQDNPNIKCPKGGHASYADALSMKKDSKNMVKAVEASYFMTYHTILKDSSQYIDAVINARNIAKDIQNMINVNLTQAQQVQVFPYSVFYVFYEQYLTLVRDAIIQLLISVLAIFLVTTLFLGLDPWSAGIIMVTISLIVVNLMGLMYWWSISFNALSLVNLVMAVGISVEFCSHIVRSFAISIQPTRIDRAKEALGTMGSSVLSGITLTKFGGIIVLAFSHSQIFQVFYFRMYLGIVIIGALHGLVLLPVLLALVGPSVNRRKLLEVYEEEREEGGPIEELRDSRSGGEALIPAQPPVTYSGPYEDTA